MPVFDRLAARGLLGRMVADILRPRFFPFMLLFSTMVGVPVIVEFGLFRFIEEQPREALVIRADDDFTVLTHDVNRLRKSDVPSIVVLGGSSMRESLYSPNQMEPLLRDATGRAFRFLNLSSGSQDYSEDLFIVDNLPKFAPGSMVFFHLTPRRLHETIDDAWAVLAQPRYVLTRNLALKNFLDDYDTAGMPDADLGSGLNLVRFFPVIVRHLKDRVDLTTEFKTNLSRLKDLSCKSECRSQILLLNWFQNPLELRKYVPQRYVKSPLPESAKHRLRIRILDHGMEDEAVAYLGAIIGESIRLAREKGAQPVVLDLPRDPILLQKEAVLKAGHQKIVAAIKETGGLYVDMRRMTDIGSEHFYDLVHPIASGREMVVADFLRVVTRLTKQTGIFPEKPEPAR
jgi:hypothetical protein